MKVGSLFSGGGLGDFGFMAAGMEITWQVEIDEYCQKILALRYPESKKYRDIKNLKGADLEPVDIITGGFPCQPFSNAGAKMGKSDDRHLWPEMFRIIQEVKPRWVVGENVPGFVNMALDDVCADLESSGYETKTLIFPAHALGAWHRRERVWIVGHAGLFGSQEYEKQTAGIKQSSKDVAYSERTKQPRKWGTAWKWRNEFGCGGWWSTEPAVGRVAHGVTDRVHRLKMLGNGQVPACTYVIGKMIIEIEQNV